MIDASKLQNCWYRFKKTISPSIKTHIRVLLTLLVSLFFSLLPVMISAAVEATKNNEAFHSVFKATLLKDAMFIYCVSYITPLIILTITMALKKDSGRYYLYPFALIGSIYVLVLGALMYSGVVARNLFSLGEASSLMQLPTLADYSILIVTLLVWYYCMYEEVYEPGDAIDNYEDYADSSFDKFNGVIEK